MRDVWYGASDNAPGEKEANMAPTMTKAETNYRPAHVTNRRCGVCSMYKRSRTLGSCTLVKGMIDPDYVCKKFEPRSKPSSVPESQIA
jgi:hypothetical protein